MKKLLLILSLAFYAVNFFSQEIDFGKMSPHPRLLLNAGEEQRIKKSIAENAHLNEVHNIIISRCNELLTTPNVTRTILGRRMLSASRDALARIFYLSYAYRMTDDNRYKDRSIQEMISVCAFEDWNPSHFLDAAEMTLAVSIGYDWLYDELTPEQKNIIKTAIIEKGINPSFDGKNFGFYHSHNNWNQVCNGGMLFGALAVYEDEKELSEKVVKRTLETIGQPLKYYEPDGAYPEGYGYWGYGTGYQVMINAGLESALGSDFGLSGKPGLKESAKFILYLSGTSGKAFNYYDNRDGLQSNPVLYWFADKYNDPSLILIEKELIVQNKSTTENNRFLPCALIYGSKIDFNKVNPPTEKMWVGHGKNPVILIRTDWEAKNGLYVGVKAGTAAYSHGHMDAGSFVFDALGERWAMDLGLQNYHSLESAGIDLWDMKQESPRWNVYRYANQNHNTLTINDKHHKVKGQAPIKEVFNDDKRMGGRIDLSDTYSEEVSEVIRDVELIDERYLQVTDYITASDKPADIVWTMVTPAEITKVNKSTLKLTQNGKTVLLSVKAPVKFELTYAPATPPNDYDAPNPGVSLIKLQCKVNAGAKSKIQVQLKP